MWSLTSALLWWYICFFALILLGCYSKDKTMNVPEIFYKMGFSVQMQWLAAIVTIAKVLESPKYLSKEMRLNKWESMLGCCAVTETYFTTDKMTGCKCNSKWEDQCIPFLSAVCVCACECACRCIIHTQEKKQREQSWRGSSGWLCVQWHIILICLRVR